VKKLALGEGVAFQWPPLENTIVFLIKGSFLPYLLPLAIFSQCCVYSHNCVCCVLKCLSSSLDFEYFDHRFKKNFLVLRGEIATPNHYRPPRDKTKGQIQHLITPLEKLPPLTYFVTIIQVASKKSYKEE